LEDTAAMQGGVAQADKERLQNIGKLWKAWNSQNELFCIFFKLLPGNGFCMDSNIDSNTLCTKYLFPLPMNIVL
jgi:hypothetical protein